MFQVIARAARFVDEHVQHADAVLEAAAQLQALGVLELVFELHQPQFEQGGIGAVFGGHCVQRVERLGHGQLLLLRNTFRVICELLLCGSHNRTRNVFCQAKVCQKFSCVYTKCVVS